jgi:hypothetical protein
MNAEAIAMAAEAFRVELEEATGETMKHVAYIDDWSEAYGCLIGKVGNHPRQDDFHRPVQMTSQIVDRGEGWVETMNTRYILGNPCN